ncbi:MAG TPA: glycosyltransferase family 4 protein [Methylophilaceae bacterium]|nr:glycosyltransferase family 4 protein [Methylophilaceae bacterium]
MSNKRILMFTMGNWSHSNGAIVRAMQSKLPQWEIIVIDLLQAFRKNKRGVLACVQDIPLLAWHSLQEGKFDRTSVLHAPATAAYINRLAHKLTREYQPAFTMQTTTRFNAGGGEVPHFTVIDSTLAAVRQRYRELFNSSERSLDRVHAFQQRVYDSSTGIFTMGRYVRDSLVRDYHVAPHRAVAIGAGPNIVLGKRSNVVGSQDILFVGTNWERKGGPPLLEAFRRIRRKYPQARFNIVGCSPEISEPGVKVIGRVPREELHRYFREARLFALPTIHEAFGIAFVEALHFGLPIIGTSIGAIPEMAEDGVNGFTVEPGDADSMAKALDRLFGDDALALRFGEASFQRSSQFTWDYAGSLLCDKMLSLAGNDKPTVTRPVTRHVEQRLAS